MKCSYCSQHLAAKAPQVVVVINDDSSQVYCGSPVPGSEDGLSCWQHAIEAWHGLIAYQQAAPHTAMESQRAVPRVRQQSSVQPQEHVNGNALLPHETNIKRRRHRRAQMSGTA